MAENYRILDGEEQQFCSNPDCKVGWQPITEYYSRSGKRHRRCKTCLSTYQREHYHLLHLKIQFVSKSYAKKLTSLGKAFRALDEAWPDKWVLVEDKGRYDYDEGRWYPTPFDYDSAPETDPFTLGNE